MVGEEVRSIERIRWKGGEGGGSYRWESSNDPETDREESSAIGEHFLRFGLEGQADSRRI